MKTKNTINKSTLEKEMKMIFKEICHTDEEYKETVRDAMRAYKMVKHDNQFRTNQNQINE